MADFRKDYEVIGELGRGGMGLVYLARQRSLDRLVAVKVILDEQGWRVNDLRRFRREANLVKDLVHPNIVRLLDFDTTWPEPYLVFEYIEGERTLAHLIDQASIPVGEVLALAEEIAAGLACMHQKNILHRDLKPANILVDRMATPKIIDLGLARSVGSEATRVTQEGQVVGTFPYMAVEQLLGQDATARCDVYSFGLMLYELAAGRAVFSAQAESPVTPIQRLAGTIPPISDMNPRVPASLDQLITRCVSREPAARPADGMALAAELARLEASRARQKTVTLQMQLMSPKSPATPVTPACSAIGATPAPPARAGREMTPTGPERTRRLVARDNVSVAEGVAMQRPQTRVLVGGLLALGLGVTCYLAGKWSAGASPAGVEPSARAQSSPAPGVRAPGTPRASMGLAELGRAVSEKLMLVRRELGTGWLKTFALQHRAVLQDATKSSKDVPSPGRTQAALRGLSKALRDHLERLGALEPVEALLARAPKYFGDASIPERERWLTRSSLCDLEMLQYFCIEHRVPWCLRASVEGCAGEWDCPAQPQTVDLKSNLARSWARDTRSGVDRYFPGGSWLDVWPLPDLGEDQRALLWFTTLRWPSRLVLDLLVNGALRKLIRFSKPTAGEDTMLVRVLAEAPGATSTPPADRLWTVTGTSMDPTIRGYTGIWLPRVFVTRRLEIRIRMVDLPLTALGIDDPALIDRVISFVPDPRKKRSGPH